MKPTKAELLDWIAENNITVRFDSPQTWTTETGYKYFTNWYVAGMDTCFAIYPTVLQTLEEAFKLKRGLV